LLRWQMYTTMPSDWDGCLMNSLPGLALNQDPPVR
jgi:hypothetical protein